MHVVSRFVFIAVNLTLRLQDARKHNKLHGPISTRATTEFLYQTPSHLLSIASLAYSPRLLA